MPNDYILRSDVEKMMQDKIEEEKRYDAVYTVDELEVLLSALSSIQSVDVKTVHKTPTSDN